MHFLLVGCLCILLLALGMILGKLTPVFSPDFAPFEASELNITLFTPHISNNKSNTKPSEGIKEEIRDALQQLETTRKPQSIDISGFARYTVTKPNTTTLKPSWEEKEVTLYIGGYAHYKANNTYAAYRCCLHTQLAGTGPLVAFDLTNDYLYNYRKFNFCDRGDIATVRTMLLWCVEKFPQSKIRIFGDSKGGLMALNFLMEQAMRKDPEQLFDKLAGVIAASPVISFKKGIENMFWYGKLVYWLGERWMPNYAPDRNLILHTPIFPLQVPTVIGAIPSDPISLKSDMDALYERLHDNNVLLSGEKQKMPNLHYFVSKRNDLKHGRIIFDQEFLQLCNSVINVN
jgi:hypothetical protein